MSSDNSTWGKFENFRNLLSREKPRNKSGHPIEVMRRENAVIIDMLDYLKDQFNLSKNTDTWGDFKVFVNRLRKLEIHYRKINEVLSKFLQTPEHIYASNLMKDEQSEIFFGIEELENIVSSDYIDALEVSFKLDALINSITLQCSREENVFYKDSFDFINPSQWDEIFVQMQKIGFITPSDPKFLPENIFFDQNLKLGDVENIFNSTPFPFVYKDNFGRVIISHMISEQEGFTDKQSDVIRYFKEKGKTRFFDEETMISYSAVIKNGDFCGLLLIYMN